MSEGKGDPSVISATRITHPRWRGLRLRVRHLVLPILVSVFLIALTGLLRLPNTLASAAACVTSLLVLVTLIASIVYAQNSTRAFCIGAIVPMFIVSIAVTQTLVDLVYGMGPHGYADPLYPLTLRADGLRFAAITGSLMATVAGALSLVLRWCFVGRDRASR